MNEIKRFALSARSSGLVVAGGRLETSGIVAAPGVARDIAAQTRSVLDQLEGLLRLADADKRNLTTMQIWLADMKDFDAMNRVYDQWVGNVDQPARACVGAALATDDYLIEIRATGVL
ncbi:RidA family protein [Massilia luteola]|jgi:enamine deaminase RidA (YjgF/YER057c/UK114 family)|uniref:RidA family protein n=1 Tax=Massilia luteola TaxID=3081751 RepID=UPI002ACC0867|nr:RidA family protein [Massilia sp. Gc5]